MEDVCCKHNEPLPSRIFYHSLCHFYSSPVVSGKYNLQVFNRLSFIKQKPEFKCKFDLKAKPIGMVVLVSTVLTLGLIIFVVFL